jgi:uncharacterized protein YceK
MQGRGLLLLLMMALWFATCASVYTVVAATDEFTFEDAGCITDDVDGE